MKQAILETYRSQIEGGVRAALHGDGAMASLLRYHIGLEDENGMPACATGKFLRPSVVLFVAEQLGAGIEDALPGAVALELIHSFSLIHDDIQDRDHVRRGRPAVWTVCGIEQAINAGDLMHNLAISEVLASSAAEAICLLDATREMIEGQCLDVAFEQRNVSVDEYLEMIDRKTGALLRCAFELGGLAAGADEKVRSTLVELGRAVGRAFQIKDDLLGIWGSEDMLGKATGSDIRRRKKTLPVLLLLQQEDARVATLYSGDALSDTGMRESDVRWIVERLDELDVRTRCEAMVHDNLGKAIDALRGLPFSANGQSQMQELIEFLARRET